MAIDKDVVQQPSKTRNKRIPFGIPRSKLSIDKPIEGYHLHWVNDEGGRLVQAQQGDYTFVAPDEVGFVEDIEEGRVSRLVGTQEDGSPMYAYLMKIPQEYYEEDQAHLQSQLDEIDNRIKGGQIDRQAGDNRYVPEGGIKINRK